MTMNRREMLVGVGASLAAGVMGVGCEARGERLVTTHEKHGKGKDLNVLHGEVANAFNKEVGERLRTLGNARAEHFRMEVHAEKDGSYTIAMQVDIALVNQGERPDRVFESRSTVWTGRDAQGHVDANYEKSIAPWVSRMRAAYPDVTFREEHVQGGSATLAYKACVLSGG